MRVKTVVEKLNLSVMVGHDYLEREFDGVYICDMLSWVMSHGQRGNIWITMQSNINVIAIASLVEFSCIIFPEAIQLDVLAQEKAREKGIILISSPDTGYEICKALIALENNIS